MKELIRKYTNIHRPGQLPDVLLFSVPRSGSTWVMQLVASQKDFKICNEPLDLRHQKICRHLGIDNWNGLYKEVNYPKILNYFQKISAGKLGIHNISPLHKQYRLFTSRVVYKVLNGAEPWHRQLTESMNAKSVLLLRHPIPVSMSRKQLPRLSAFVDSDFTETFSKEQIAFARKMIEKGSWLEKGVLSWCFQMCPYLKDLGGVDAVIAYEQTVLDPEPVIDILMEKLCLNDKSKILRALGQPSGSTYQCDQKTKEILGEAKGKERDTYLVTKWFNKTNSEEKKRVQEVLDCFDVKSYQADKFLPQLNIWIGKSQNECDLLEKQLKDSLNA